MKHWERKSLPSLLRWGGMSGCFVVIFSNTANWLSLSEKGGLPVAISTTVHLRNTEEGPERRHRKRAKARGREREAESESESESETVRQKRE